LSDQGGAQQTRQQTRAIIFDFFGVVRAERPGGAAIDRELLDFIAQLKPKFKIGLLSNTGSSRLEDFLPRADLTRYFDVVVTSAEIGYIKPEPQAYLTAAKLLGVPPQACLMVDDLAVHCQGARNVGMRAVQYTSLAQLQEELAPLAKLP
jgi:putative hydrolase of the HAD superfamily